MLCIYCVNALNGLSPFLPVKFAIRHSDRMMCVNALNGLSPFLLKINLKEFGDEGSVCQRPKRAFSISTAMYLLYSMMEGWCVNALNGLSPFLQFMSQDANESLMCVNALNGLSPFLHIR